MAGMKRFVTYIYSYEEKKKGGNAGFAKIEIRGAEGRIEIHLRETYPRKAEYSIYFFAEKQGEIVGVPLGEMRLQNGAGDFSVIFKVENLCGTSADFYGMEGIILIGGEPQIFMSRWKEGNPLEVCKEQFRLWDAEKLPEEREEELAEEQKEESKEERREAPQEHPAAMEQKTPEMENSESLEISPQELEETEEETTAATEVPMRNIFSRYDWLEIWERLKENHENFMLYWEQEICCVKIELKDIRELPRRYWYLGNNSFLLHGFFNYHYLVVGKIGEAQWFIGVPGIYQNQERVMAAIFGFPEFLPEPVENRFGYWYRIIEES